MKALGIVHSGVNRESLLQMAERIPGAWIGIRIVAFLLILAGWKSTQVAELFGMTSRAVVKWIHKANDIGIKAIEDKPRSGRPSQFDENIMSELDKVLSISPKEVGIERVRWDGVVLVEYLKRNYQIEIHVRHAQRLIRKLGYSLKQPIYRYVQASKEGVEEFREVLKKLQEAIKSVGNRVIIFEDETGFSLHPKLGRVWAKKGTQPYAYLNVAKTRGQTCFKTPANRQDLIMIHVAAFLTFCAFWQKGWQATH